MKRSLPFSEVPRVRSLLGVYLFVLVAAGSTLVACATATPTPAPAPVKEQPKAAAPTATTAPAAKPTATAQPSPAAAKPTAAPAAAPPKALVPVRFGTQGSVSDAGVIIALEKGYFKDVGLDVQFTPFASAGVDMNASLATGQLDVGGSGVNSALLGAVARGVNVKIVADKGSHPPGYGFEPFVVRKALIDSGQVKTEADLKGKNIVAVAPLKGNAAFILIERVLAKAKLTLDDVEFTMMPFAQMPAAFANGAVDAGPVLEPTAAAIVENGFGRIWADSAQIYPNMQMGVLAYSPAFAEKNPQAAKDFMLAYLRGVRDYNQVKDKGVGKAQIVGWLTKYTAIKDQAVYDKMIWAGLNPDGQVFYQSMVDDQEFYLKHKVVQTRVDLKTVVDNQYVDYALAKLGKYKP